MALASPGEIDLVNLDHIIANYNSEIDRCLSVELPRLEDRLWQRICAYDVSAGHTAPLADHLPQIF